MEQENRLEEIRQYARTTVLEQTEMQKEHNTSIDKLNMLSKQVSKIEPTVTPVQKVEEVATQPVKEEKKETKSLSEIIMEQHLAKQNEENIQEQAVDQIEEIQEEQVEEQVESLYASSLSLEASNENQLDEVFTPEHNSKNYKFRFRLLTGVFCLLLAIIGGWIIGEAIEIGKTSTEIITETSKGTEYNVNLTKLITNISKIDQDDEPATPSEGTLLPIDELIPITPQAPLDTTGYEEESNWFDKICNWIINIFGG